MAIRVALNHKTRYRYAKPVWLSPHVVRLRPAPHSRTPVPSYSLKVTPSEHFINWQQDPYSNRLARLVFPKKTSEFSVEVDLVAELTVINPFDFFLEKYAEEYPFTYDAVLSRELIPYLEAAPPGPALQALIGEVRSDHGKEKLRSVDFLVAVNQLIQRRIKYLIRMEPGIQTPEETLALQSGSCRDSAWLQVQLLRHLGLAARFVSGYLIQLAPDVKSLDGPSGTEKDFTDLHAWTEVYLPGAGWVGLDATSGLFADEGHIPLACSADPVTAAAITGFFSPDNEAIVDAEDGAGGEVDSKFDFSMSVTRIHEDPRVTKPYSDEQWAEIETLGHQVDAQIKAQDVRLTLGGEPTFVSIDDMDGEEWNMTALGPNKYRLAERLARRLRTRFAPGGLLHHGQGKWYPGESLPRWALGLYWRKDGQPVWRDPALSADETDPGKPAEHKPIEEDARKFILELSQRLEVNPNHALPGYEDSWYYLWKERRLPVNVDPFDNKLENPEDRERMARIFEEGLQKVVGYALPLKRESYSDGGSAWASGAWFFRPERMYLIPGDSPMGFRLPLDSIPWVRESEFPHIHEQDPMENRPPLPSRDAMSRQARFPGAPGPRFPEGFVEQRLGPEVVGPRPRRQKYPEDLPPAQGESASWIVRTALCTQVRDGVLRVFMPPQRYLEDYLELVAAIEDTAANLGQPVLIEGYTPPSDPRINTIKVTPDPGVIEVNTSPASCWDELVNNTTALYEEARLTRLGTEKFMLDGRHTGTGGGNHIVVGGPSPADSPLLRNPALLSSLVGYWHNHPALSYLFSGLFVGPTSQAPRIDEARNDQVYEVELAFKQVPESKAPLWLVDRVFRNLLVDATGNTHRAEFCIDKLYAPDSASGRQGLLEMRAFEMPPHARMSLTQHLLLQSLIAKFWKRPYDEKLVRWRTEIHDRFMLPHFVRQDLEDVVADLNEAGYPFKLEWFAPHFEFRFPHFGTIEHRGVELELRQAIEPWHVLGEEGAAGSTVRYVDSSLERVQVLVNGMVDPRHVVTCNGRRVPMHPTGPNGQFVAGVRYRAWQPPNCLHPTIGVHSPLVFDIVDTWAGRSIGGCTYHVSHPGGLSYERFPVNAYEAESRRISRFFKFGHTPGPMAVEEERVTHEYPLTLDLRLR
ncbi:MAG TPA: transglutaminase family protein [Terriglobales bacterium]|nr:transglutaminase family protein [Terriglobales bacterium]